MYAQLLILASFVMASYQDVKDRAVSDLVWIPAAGGAGYILYSFYAGGFFGFGFFLVKFALVGGVALAFTLLGGIGQADGIAIAFIAADPYVLSPLAPLVGTAVVALGHIAYEFSRGNVKEKTIPMAQFLREQRWIPKAIVSDGATIQVSADVNVARDEVEKADKPGASVVVRYGVPTVAYLGIGYAAYLLYLVLFNYGVFAALP